MFGFFLLALSGCAAATPVSIRTIELEEAREKHSFQATPTERRLLRNVAEQGDLEGMELIEAGFIASGVEGEAALAHYVGRVKRLERKLRSTAVGNLPTERSRARAILTWLHGNVLERYRARHSKLTEVLETGDYNCVSATLLFNGLLRRFGIQSRVVDSPTHVLSHAFVDGTWVEVETTNPRGFDPFRSEDEYNAFLRSRGLRSGYQRLDPKGNLQSVLIPRTTQERRLVANRQLPGFLVWNDAIISAERGERQRAWKLYELATRLLPGEGSVRHNADVLLNNLAYQHIENQAYGKALRLLLFADHAERGSSVRSNLRVMMSICFDRLAGKAVERGDVKELEQTLRFAHRRLGKDKVLDHNHSLYVGRLANKLVNRGDFDEALKLLSRHMKWDKPYLSNRYSYLVAREASARQSNGDKEKARELLEREIPYLIRLGGDSNNLGVLEEMLGLHYFREDNFKRAAYYFRSAIDHGNGSSARTNLGASWFNLALEAYKKGACGQAYEYAEKAREIEHSPTLDRIQRECRR